MLAALGAAARHINRTILSPLKVLTGRVASPGVPKVDSLVEILAQHTVTLAKIEKEVLPNGGSSLADSIKRNEESTKRTESDLQETKVDISHINNRMEKMEQALSDHIAKFSIMEASFLKFFSEHLQVDTATNFKNSNSLNDPLQEPPSDSN